MNLGYRIFVVHGESVVRLSQKSFNDFYFLETAALPQYAGHAIVIVIAVYELKNRKPKRIIRMDTQRIKVDTDGAIDKEHHGEGLRLVANRISSVFDGKPLSATHNSNVVDAQALFDERRWKQRHPELSGPALKKILAILFGAVHAI